MLISRARCLSKTGPDRESCLASRPKILPSTFCRVSHEQVPIAVHIGGMRTVCAIHALRMQAVPAPASERMSLWLPVSCSQCVTMRAAVRGVCPVSGPQQLYQ